jgi:hypothetical protein
MSSIVIVLGAILAVQIVGVLFVVDELRQIKSILSALSACEREGGEK